MGYTAQRNIFTAAESQLHPPHPHFIGSKCLEYALKINLQNTLTQNAATEHIAHWYWRDACDHITCLVQLILVCCCIFVVFFVFVLSEMSQERKCKITSTWRNTQRRQVSCPSKHPAATQSCPTSLVLTRPPRQGVKDHTQRRTTEAEAKTKRQTRQQRYPKAPPTLNKLPGKQHPYHSPTWNWLIVLISHGYSRHVANLMWQEENQSH